MNYIGSKYSLIKSISELISTKVPMYGCALDLFSGTTTVAQQLKLLGFETYANDWQYYSFVTASAYLFYDDYPLFELLLRNTDLITSKSSKKNLLSKDSESFILHSVNNRKRISGEQPVFSVLRYLQTLPGKKGKFYEEYCDGGSKKRMYFSRENGLKIQAIGDQITEWDEQGLLSSEEMHWLRASLLESADRVANTASVYGAYLKKVKKSAAKNLEMVVLAPVVCPWRGATTKAGFPVANAWFTFNWNGILQHQAFCSDAATLFASEKLPMMTLTYIDPPYNSRQYSGNYHILETIAKWDVDSFTPRGVTGLRDSSKQSSPFCSKNKVFDAFDKLFSTLQTQFILFSYNNEGLLTEDQLRSLFSKYCVSTEFFRMDYGRFRADNDGENRKYRANKVQEYLILGKCK
jgi:adenine-specific DNA-methyltransferase